MCGERQVMIGTLADGNASAIIFEFAVLASNPDSASFLEPISQALQEPMAILSVASGMFGSLALLWWNRNKAFHNVQDFEHRMSDRLEEMREHESHAAR